MKTRSSSANESSSKASTSPTKSPKKELTSAPSSPPKKRSAKKEEPDADGAAPSEDEEKKKKEEEKKPTTSPRKKPKTEGVSDVGELPPKSFGTPKGERKHGVLEQGRIYFVYRPRVQLEEVHSREDIAHFHLILLPSTPKGSYRLLTIGRNVLPRRSESKGKRPDICWGKVLDISDDLTSLKERLGPRTYETKTRGTRYISSARVAGKGHYVIHSHEAKDTPKASKDMSKVFKTVLAYALETPHELGKCQEDLHIEQEGSFQIQIKDPKSKSTNPSIRDMPATKRPAYPKSLSTLFTTKFIPLNPPSLLNYSGGELLFLPSNATVKEQIGLEAEEELLVDAKKRGKKEEGGSGEEEEEAHEEARKALRELGVLELGVGERALEGYWE